MSDRFKQYEELAVKISNDINEDIDCRETREQLRNAIGYWSEHSANLAVLLGSIKVSALVNAMQINAEIERVME